MADHPKEVRESAEVRFEKMKKAASAQTESDLDKARKKTARLKSLRLEKEAADSAAEQESKPAAPPRKAPARQRKS